TQPETTQIRFPQPVGHRSAERPSHNVGKPEGHDLVQTKQPISQSRESEQDRKEDHCSLWCDRRSTGQVALPAMRKGAILNRLTAGQRIGDKILWPQVGTNLAIAANFEVVR